MTDENKPTGSAFKDLIHRNGIIRLAEAFKRADPHFAVEPFVVAACTGLADLELKARVWHVVSAMEAVLPPDPRTAIEIVRTAARHFERHSEEGSFPANAWPLVEFVGKIGLAEFDLGMAALCDMTSLFSAEFAIRGFIAQNPERAFTYLRRWTTHDDHHVRRLVSEGTRPRLPWGSRLRVFDEFPDTVVALLDSLVDDQSEYVRRSVSNHINDLSKDYPDVALDVCSRWIREQPSQNRLWVVRRGLRTLVKKGNARALTLVGCHADAAVDVLDLVIKPQQVVIGEIVTFRFGLKLRHADSATVAVDYRIGPDDSKRGAHSRLFRLKTVPLAADTTLELEKSHRIRQVTTRKTDPGPYFLSIVVNGVDQQSTKFQVLEN